MSAYRFSAQIIGRSSGRSATGAAAYRSGALLTDERTGLVFDYARKGGVLHSEIVAPADAPAWMADRNRLWNAVELAEKRKDAQLSREILLNLPHELDDAQRRDLVLDFVRAEFVAHGMVADVSIHAPHRQGDDRNHHAHVMLTLRSLTGDGFGAKARDWNSPERLEGWREAWAQHQNRALERAGRSERVDHRSLEARGIDREPEPKQGPVATEMERNGRPSKAGDDRRAVKARNAERERLKHRAEVIDLALARRRRDQNAAGDVRRVEREKHRFETWANGRRAALQTVRLDAEGELGRKHHAERMALIDRQRADFRPHEERLAADLQAIARRQERGRGLRGVLYRLSGRATADSRQADGIRATLAGIRLRQTEQMQSLAARQAGGRSQAAGLAAQAAARLEQRISAARDRRETDGWTGYQGGTAGKAEKSPREADEAGRDDPDRKTPEATPAQSAGQGGAGQLDTPEWREAFDRLKSQEAGERARGRERDGRER